MKHYSQLLNLMYLLDIIFQALTLIESFCLADGGLRTTIGRADGKPYEYTYDWALNENSLNKIDFSPIVNGLKNCKPRL